MMPDVGAAFVTLFVVIDPLGIVPLFAALTATMPEAQCRRIAIKGVAIAAAVMLAFVLAGSPLLSALGITLPAFRVAGRLLLLLLAIDMVMVRHSGLRETTADEAAEISGRDDVSVFPLAIPLIAGPGALTSIVLLTGKGGGVAAQATVAGLAAGVLVITLVCLLLASRLMRLLGMTGVNVVTRVFGIVTAALAVQYIIDGILAVWPHG